MSPKPTYEELEQRIKELKKEAAERKKFEQALKESEKRYRSLVENIDFGVTMIDSDHNIVMTNVSQARMFNKSVHEFIGKKCFREYERRENVCPHCPGVQAMSTGHTAHTETEGIRDDGSRFSVSINAFPILNEEGHPTGFIEVVEDITERKKAEKALWESEERYRLLVQHAPAGIYEFDMDTMKFISVNKVMCEYTGYTRDEFLALDPWELIADESKKTRDRLLEEVFSGNPNPAPVEYKIRGKNNREFWVLVNSSFSFENSIPKRATAVVHDLTAIRQAQEEKKQLEAQLHQAHKMEAIGTLAGGIAHDFNNILGIILGNTELAIDDIPTWNPARMNLEEINTASLRAKDVVRQLLSFARKTKLEKKPINIIPIVKESFKLLRSSIPTSIEIRQNIPKNIDTILAHPTQINQIIINLCTNADHAMPDGGIIAITLKNVELDKDATVQHPELQPRRYVNLTVSDTGHGISQEEIDQIFDPYYTTKEIGQGTGMGLAVVHGVVKEHNGLIAVESELGKGTTFSIFFPVVAKDAVVETETDEKLPTGNERILFIDDEEAIVRLGRQRLERLGYKVEATISPFEALTLFRSKPDQYNLVITDLTMPKMAGDRLVKEFLNIRPDIPIILCTGFSEKIDEYKAKEIGAADYIEKPLDKRDFAFKVRKVLDRK